MMREWLSRPRFSAVSLCSIAWSLPAWQSGHLVGAFAILIIGAIGQATLESWPE
jgi:hypothetical protein